MSAELVSEFVARAVAGMQPLTDEEVEHVAALLRPSMAVAS